MIFKVDFKKAYDLVQCDYLDDVLKKFGFGDRWCGWIQSYPRSSKGLVIVNGSLTREFQFHRGLKQGDPLSLFLFILIMESLHISVQRVVDVGMFRVQVLECFYRASCLRINLNKSKLMGISVANVIVDQAAAKIGCAMLEAPLSYLGSKVGGLMSRVQSWNEIVNILIARLSNWKMKTLSIGGILTLLNSVLGSMPIYHMSLFNVPVKVLRIMESIRCHFFNDANHNGSSLWARVIKGIHGEDGKLGKNVNHSHPSIWLDIVREMEQLKNHGYSLRRIPRGGIEHVQFLEFLASMKGVALVDMNDRWVWSLEGSGEFFVASVRRLIDERWLSEVSTKTRWINVVPIKVNVHAWKVRLDCLPTRLNISR
ncbi:RNA-directed DNA polymerase, eukaryota, reverse transcriptase zinc-binding domain protein [Tanacetum coccineum]